MLPTLRLFLLLLVAAPLIAGSVFAPQLIWIAVAYLVASFVVVISDLIMTPQPLMLEVERINDSRLSLGADNLITIILANTSARPLHVTLRDEYPDGFPSETRFMRGVVGAYDIYEAKYHVRPLRRGDYSFGDVIVRYRGVLGTFLRQVRYPAQKSVKVYPNVLEVRKYDLLARKGLLYEQGLRPAQIYGQGSEFERLREYTPDDEFRRINWKATARRGKPIAADFETERSQHVMCLIDTGRLMAPPLGEIAKLDYVINTALLLSYVATLKGDHVGMLSFADEVTTYIAPERGKAQFQKLLEAFYNVHAQPIEADHGAALSYFQVKQKRRTLAVLFTDLATLDATRPLIAHMARLARHHLVMCVTISDPYSSALVEKPAGDSEGLYQRAVAEMLKDERQVILDTLNRHGIMTVDVPADRLTISVVNSYLRLKAQGKL